MTRLKNTLFYIYVFAFTLVVIFPAIAEYSNGNFSFDTLWVTALNLAGLILMILLWLNKINVNRMLCLAYVIVYCLLTFWGSWLWIDSFLLFMITAALYLPMPILLVTMSANNSKTPNVDNCISS